MRLLLFLILVIANTAFSQSLYRKKGSDEKPVAIIDSTGALVGVGRYQTKKPHDTIPSCKRQFTEAYVLRGKMFSKGNLFLGIDSHVWFEYQDINPFPHTLGWHINLGAFPTKRLLFFHTFTFLHSQFFKAGSSSQLVPIYNWEVAARARYYFLKGGVTLFGDVGYLIGNYYTPRSRLEESPRQHENKILKQSMIFGLGVNFRIWNYLSMNYQINMRYLPGKLPTDQSNINASFFTIGFNYIIPTIQKKPPLLFCPKVPRKQQHRTKGNEIWIEP